VAGDGTRRVLVEGDRLFAGDQLIPGRRRSSGAFAKWPRTDPGRGSSLQMTLNCWLISRPMWWTRLSR
jgi:hypothetical protein